MKNANDIQRRTFLRTASAVALASQSISTLHAAPSLEEAKVAAEKVHAELWRRFIDKHQVLLDFTELDGSINLPTPEECREGKPNALGWWTPIENGAMFNGLYLDGAVNRALRTQSDADKAKARRLVEGLLRLADCSNIKGFIGRGFASDGKTTWPMGSNDQTGPWFYGLWRYLQSGLADDAFRRRIAAKFIEVAEVLVQSEWRMPAEPPFHFRGSFNGFSWGGAPRLLFVCKAMHQLTGHAMWDERYRAALHEGQAKGGITRVEACERGMVFETKGEAKPNRATWTGSCSAVCLRGLWEMEQNEAVRARFANGLRATAAMAVEGLSYREKFSHDDDARYENDWRKLNVLWKPQQTEDQATDLARLQLNELNKMSPRRKAELNNAREAMFAAWAITLCPDRAWVKQHEPEILATICHFRADKLHFVSFFPLESAWWRLPFADR